MGKESWKWDPEQSTSFKTLKEVVMVTPTLVFPTDNDQFEVEADSSDLASGVVLSQLQQNTWKPIAYMSKALNDVERNYKVHDKEMLAIMRALAKWQHYLQGVRQPFKVWMDHKNLEYFMTVRKLNHQQARWSLELVDYDFNLRHCSGQSNKKADLLSRQKDHQEGVGEDNTGVMMLKQKFFRALETKEENADVELMDKIWKSRWKVEDKVKEKVQKKERDWEEENGIIMWEGSIYVPKDKRLRDEVTRLHHNTHEADHPGQFKTVELILWNYWWPRIHGDVRAYVDGCSQCQQMKTSPEKPRGKLSLNGIPQRIWQHISVDIIMQLPSSRRYDAIMVVVDCLLK